MSTLVNWNGQQYLVPAYNDTGYAQGNGNLSQYLVAISTGSLQQVGGLFQLTADADFGPNFGLVSSYFKSRSANIASAGVLRLANTDAIKWRNSDNSADITLAMNATGTAARTYTIPDIASSDFVMTEGAQTVNGAKTFGSAIIGSLTGAASLNLLLTGGTMTGNIAMSGTQKLTGLAAGSGNGDSLRYEQLVGAYLPLGGGTMSGNIAMGTNKLTGLGAGSTSGDSVRYEQVVFNSGDQSISGIKTFTGQLIGKGTATNDSAAAGDIGEYVESYVSSVSFPSNAIWGDATSISLTAGDWDLSVANYYAQGSAVVTSWRAGISITSGDSTTGMLLGENHLIHSTTPPGGDSVPVPFYRLKLNATTTVYAKFRADYSVATPTANVFIAARRRR